ncbi:hypothetical protein LCGC14_1280290 [marine sediment metagenome]|uniref:Uncharacterized protein n=1 Tax=marine sediment metagenome TaxID=412755 RepID=A0A0F9KX26_9ZZZZ
MILAFVFLELSIDKKGTKEEFGFYVVHGDDFNSKSKKKASRWCKKNCEKRYVMKTSGCWFQTRGDAEAFELKWSQKVPFLKNM